MIGDNLGAPSVAILGLGEAGRLLARDLIYGGVKGMSAAVCEALEAARAAGVEAWLRSAITRTFVTGDEVLLDRLIDGTYKHAKRRAHKMHAAGALLEQLGVASPVWRRLPHRSTVFPIRKESTSYNDRLCPMRQTRRCDHLRSVG
jgi:hypothetical protein